MPRSAPHICILSDGRRIPFSIQQRPGEPFYFVYFRSPNSMRLERSTKEKSQKRAIDSAHQRIKEEYEPKEVVRVVSWDEAICGLRRQMQVNGNRAATIDDYVDTLNVLRRLFPECQGPGEITAFHAKKFKTEYQTQEYIRHKKPVERNGQPLNDAPKRRGPKPKPKPEPRGYTRKPRTVASRLNKLRVIWSKWFIEELEYLSQNPWEDIAPPKLDKLTPRYLSAEEIQAFFLWLNERWKGWRLPVLFFTVKGMLGNRISELVSLRSEQLQEGRIVFSADETKSREERKAILPADIFTELKTLAGPIYVWEVFPAQLVQKLTELEKPNGKLKRDFSPSRFRWWLQDEIDDYCKAHPTVKRFSAHAFRKRAMTEAYKLGIPLEKAAVAFGCNPNTMRQHYLALDKTAIADEVLTTIADAVKPKAK